MIFDLLDIGQQRTMISEMETNEVRLTIATAYCLERDAGHGAKRGSLAVTLSWRDGTGCPRSPGRPEFEGQNTREERDEQRENSRAHTGLGIVLVPIRVVKGIIRRTLIRIFKGFLP